MKISHWLIAVTLAPFVFLFFAAINALTLYLTYNQLVPLVSSYPTISYTQALAFMFVASCFNRSNGGAKFTAPFARLVFIPASAYVLAWFL